MEEMNYYITKKKTNFIIQGGVIKHITKSDNSDYEYVDFFVIKKEHPTKAKQQFVVKNTTKIYTIDYATIQYNGMIYYKTDKTNQARYYSDCWLVLRNGYENLTYEEKTHLCSLLQ